MIDNYHSSLANVIDKYPVIGQAMLHHRNTRGLPMSFRDMPYLAPLYAEIPNLQGADIRKAVQTGLSELFIILALNHAGWEGKIVAYILPTFSVRDRFVKQRINKILSGSSKYRSMLPKETDLGNNRMKRFGSGSLLFLGSNTTGDFVEFSADTMIVDEIDQCEQANLSKAKDRIRASKDPRMYRLGNPTLPNRGICELFDKSDQSHWFTKCPKCNHWQTLQWDVNIVQKNDDGLWIPRDKEAIDALRWTKVESYKGKIEPVCSKCHGLFPRQTEGQWVQVYPTRDRRGYTLSRLDILSQNLTNLYQEWIAAQSDINKLSTFYTSVLGTGFEHSGARISSEMLGNCCETYTLDYGGGPEYKKEIVSIGIDVGTLLNVVVSIAVKNEEGEVRRKTVLVCTVRKFGELKDIITRYNVDSVVIDAMPEIRKSQELRDWGRLKGLNIWLCRFYPTQRVGEQAYGMKLNWRERVITVDRTQIMDATFDEIRDKKHQFPSDVFSVLGFLDQMKAPVRVVNPEKGRIVWNEGSAADHYRLADCYDRVAFDMSTMTGSFG
ncbi:MAG TPA: hypothetical protein EYN67_03950 [Flavobacteriales bacterium]|nr:hypothetical protein [Flavobacteriales bacterium]